MRLQPVAALILATACACSGSSSPRPAEPRLRLWHSFNAGEAEALNQLLDMRARTGARAVEPTILPFSRAQRIVRETLQGAGPECPDLVRIDATWLPGLATAKLVQPVPSALATAEATGQWLPETEQLVTYEGQRYGIPQAIDGLALLYNESLIERGGVHWPPDSLNDLLASARQLTSGEVYGMSVRVDGYWFVPFLRAWGGSVLDPTSGRLGVDEPAAAAALTEFARLFSGDTKAAPPPAAHGEEAPTLQRRFRAGQIAIVVDGPWAIAGLRGAQRAPLGVAPFPNDPAGHPAAPLGGQLFVVPTCSRHAAKAWELAIELTSPDLQARWAVELGIVPTTHEGLERADDFTRQMRDALRLASPMPRHPVTTELFDDLSPAVAAVVAGDASAQEALGGVTRAWSRILRRHGIEPQLTPPRASEVPQ